MASSPGAMDLVVFGISIHRIIKATLGATIRNIGKYHCFVMAMLLVLMKIIKLGYLFVNSVSV